MPGGRLLRSHARSVSRGGQAEAEAALVDAAHRGEIRLHVSTLEGSVLSIGAHGARPGPEPDGAAAAFLRRRTGGRPIACGEGFRLVTLALPGRTALLGEGVPAIAPEQVLNRVVRGLLDGLRRLGLDPVYPGLDFVTVGARSVAHLGFAETARGAVLFQATLAWEATLAESTRLLDELDPAGAVPTTPIPAPGATCFAALADGRRADGDPERLCDLLARSWATAAGLEIGEAGPPTRRDLDAHDTTGDAPFPPPPAGAAVTLAPSRLGLAVAWVRATGGRIADAALGGDILAPDGARTRIAAALAGRAADREAIGSVLGATLDRERTWVLGVTAGELADLLARAASESA
jgi:hypothetical protein